MSPFYHFVEFTGEKLDVIDREDHDTGNMRSPLPAGRQGIRFSLKASHHKMTLRISHRRDSSPVVRDGERERYIAPPKRRRG